MASFTSADHKIFSKYYGVANFQETEEYWQDILTVYKETLLPLPLIATDKSLAEVSAMLHCPPGVCGECCRYRLTAVRPEDIERLVAAGVDRESLIAGCEPGENCLNMRYRGDSCQFLVNNACSVYDARPSICRTFPVQTGVASVTINGRHVEQIHIRVKCKAAVNVIRQVMSKALKVNPGLVLLPDLTIIDRR